MLSFATFPALIPTFETAWEISGTEAGLISGAYFAGYVAVVPVLTSLTDRVDPKRVILFSLVVGAVGSAGFAALADGTGSASLFRFLQGAGLAGTYMPGLKALSDQIEGPSQSRSVAFYTSGFGIGAGLSFIVAGEVGAALDWRWAFGANALGSAASFLVVAFGVPAAPVRKQAHDTHLLDFRPVLRNRDAMRFILGYTGHNWELFALRSWMVPFLTFTLGLHAAGESVVKATTIAAVATLLGVPSSILGNEMAARFGRTRWIVVVAGLAVVLSLFIGFAAALSYGLVVALCLVYGLLATGDSAALTAGTVAAAAPGQRGATLAMHSFVGFIGGVVAPPAVGAVLDISGGDSVLGWGLAFIAIGAGSAAALAAVCARGRRI